jgi:Secretion system C-terminal sorting domain
MRRNSTYKKTAIIFIAAAIMINFAAINNFAYSQTDTSYERFLKPKQAHNYAKSPLHLVLPPLRPAVISTQKVSVYKPDDKLLNNVQVFPNPVTDQINVRYELSRYSTVTIKVVDVLGNDIKTIFDQRLEPGEKVLAYPLNNKLSKGFYFVRVIAGTESIIKRISVL